MTGIKLLFIAMMVGKISYSQLTFTITSSTGAFSLSCSVPLISMGASSNFSNNVNFLWATPTQGTLNSNNLTVWNDPGVYTITATSGTLSSVQTITVTSDKVAPSVSVTTSSSTITCSNYSFVLTANATPTNVTYSWIEPGVGLGCSSYSCFQTQAGNYAVIVKNLHNDCQDTAKITIHDGRIYPILATNGLFTVACPNGTVDLIPSITSPTNGLSFSWNAPPNSITSATNNLILKTNAPGAYTFTATHTLSGCSSKAQLLVYACVGITENQLNSIEVFPNPTTDIVKIQSLPYQNNGYTFQVIDLCGQIVCQLHSKENSTQIDLKELSNGFYYLRISSQDSQRTIRLLKQ